MHANNKTQKQIQNQQNSQKEKTKQEKPKK